MLVKQWLLFSVNWHFFWFLTNVYATANTLQKQKNKTQNRNAKQHQARAK